MKGVLFDVDGTLVDSNYVHVLAWWQAFRQAGVDVPMAAIHRCVGMGGGRLIEELLDDGRDRSGDEQIKAAHRAVFSTYWPALRRFDGAREVVDRAAAEGLAVVLASSAEEAELAVLRRVIDADGSITAATSSADADNSKPAPDILQAALDAAGLRAEDTVFVGDAVWDIQAAGDLGIPCIGLECGGTSADVLTQAGAAEVYRNPQDLLEHFSESALGGLLRA
ncbi:HAD family hydrolase [Arthrobacter sulfonylureivorans]|uniref:HAD family hydrolase n=1 Tax=Arthrobacter sulfonylureivorans TaxID=2486855 RepID=A0ABY3W3Y9_9MICC|nr:HAD family hydrolase [Arthrobacter sulfonylureivorans]UNK44865.1 HAD family hydrolase [Arthrobacter sulfonylureivorans]